MEPSFEEEAKWDQRSKRSANNESDVVHWIEIITGGSKGDQSIWEWLKTGIVLCSLVNCLRPGIIRIIHQTAVPFKQMDNITNFLNAARQLGLPESSMFDVPDLYEEKNVGYVLTCLYALGGAIQTTCPEFTGPKLGIPLIAQGKDVSKPAKKIAALLHLDPKEVAAVREEVEALRETNARIVEENAALRKRSDVDIPHWTSELRSLSIQLEEIAEPLVSIPLGEKLVVILDRLQEVEDGLRSLKGAHLREELDELKRAFASHLNEGERREAALREEVLQLSTSLKVWEKAHSFGCIDEAVKGVLATDESPNSVL
ncbi:unnamed protein product [Polarella glacialis]|uniref:Calponin-homology (CH) domain-containing protein n=1 Tax=Polarella glacialis TaxID=89957 RepID=A0A813HLT0_POLGL|nr:unnamed protein product [Polarella glacialis]CAE8638711.1 unnamed protein product [Polarella glacialis]|mmetsp:Transcript_86969/g.156657  ORF Transcript_86969/g.156657 Transcript_86969/m.156657 type:complete len:315 (+) Transcript_86969:76-1020(+)